MEIILLQKINKLGNIGDIVKVKPGFGRNHLIPSGKALRATIENKQVFETYQEEIIYLKTWINNRLTWMDSELN